MMGAQAAKSNSDRDTEGEETSDVEEEVGEETGEEVGEETGEETGEQERASAELGKKASKQATERLLTELRTLNSPETQQLGFQVSPLNDNLYQWRVRLFGFDDDAQIRQDLFMYESVTGRDHVMLEVLFPHDYPSCPPFIRVVYPRFHQYTGHITLGGSICIKSLTKSGWETVSIRYACVSCFTEIGAGIPTSEFFCDGPQSVIRRRSLDRHGQFVRVHGRRGACGIRSSCPSPWLGTLTLHNIYCKFYSLCTKKTKEKRKSASFGEHGNLPLQYHKGSFCVVSAIELSDEGIRAV